MEGLLKKIASIYNGIVLGMDRASYISMNAKNKWRLRYSRMRYQIRLEREIYWLEAHAGSPGKDGVLWLVTRGPVPY